MLKSEQVVHNIAVLIENGTLQSHTKLPSLRAYAQQTGFSVVTIFSAYQRLEALGLVYAKEKSGFFVAAQASMAKQTDVQAVEVTSKVQVNSRVFQYLKALTQYTHASLGSAFPDPDVLGNSRLMNTIARNAKYRKSYYSGDAMPPGNATLRQFIAHKYTLQGIPTQADDIVITSGALDALNLSLQVLTTPGDYILLQSTVFYGAWQLAEKFGLKVITFPSDHEINLDAFEAALKKYPIKVCWLMLNSHNPIGFTVSQTVKAKIAQLLATYQVYLVEDDVYQELYFGLEKPLPVQYYDQDQWVLHCSSFSKVLGAGARIGWVRAGQFSDKIQHQQLMSSLSVNPMLQYALAEFTATLHYEKHLRQIRSQLAKRKQSFYQNIKAILPESCHIFYYSSGYFLWIELPKHIDSTALYETLLMHDIVITPSILFQKHTAKQSHFRVNCSYEWNDRYSQIFEFISKIIKEWNSVS
ncbi:PLP-dependent aminotransferase family protein [Acinetobacter apis]|uniref:DNA-binding transcriptional regulator, MocR family, contains an aminotransferase domain n=1 Tax=Acinetobacter apis TaxID=1229165 RepID=A0A217EF04_9GAMM|nr:PLP-dependent aminotransferase family protein [Acinetobacter apis]SNQ29081.1 DNA-binding transcriptional regulator, MocR family, contains an aminotransferase domain [Acinetobacter apis]